MATHTATALPLTVGAMKRAERPPVGNLSISLRLAPLERARLEELAAFYRQNIAATFRQAIESLHRKTFPMHYKGETHENAGPEEAAIPDEESGTPRC